MQPLFRPFVVFDAGIGSYAVVDMIRRRYPWQDVLYVADRASFPYGAKSAAELSGCVQRVINAALAVHPSVILVASNAPTVMVFDRLAVPPGVTLRGVFPPIREALRVSKSKQVVVMGVKSLTDSPAFQKFVAAEQAAAWALQARIEGVNASSMVELVESAVFLSDPERAQAQVDEFSANIRQQWPQADVYTLSSTHLPWLRSFFERAAPEIRFLDPRTSGGRQPGEFDYRGIGSAGDLGDRQSAVSCRGVRGDATAATARYLLFGATPGVRQERPEGASALRLGHPNHQAVQILRHCDLTR